MSILIKGLGMPADGELLCINIYPDGKVCINLDLNCERIATAVPAADVAPVRHGRWIVDDITGLITCSECKNDAPLDTTGGGQWCSPFCHSCGAKMDGDGE